MEAVVWFVYADNDIWVPIVILQPNEITIVVVVSISHYNNIFYVCTNILTVFAIVTMFTKWT